MTQYGLRKPRVACRVWRTSKSNGTNLGVIASGDRERTTWTKPRRPQRLKAIEPCEDVHDILQGMQGSRGLQSDRPQRGARMTHTLRATPARQCVWRFSVRRDHKIKDKKKARPASAFSLVRLLIRSQNRRTEPSRPRGQAGGQLGKTRTIWYNGDIKNGFDRSKLISQLYQTATELKRQTRENKEKKSK